MFPKPRKWTSRKYLKWIKTQRCCCGCGRPADDPHHIHARGFGKGTSTKLSDCFAIPMTRQCHDYIEKNRDETWEKDQAMKMIEKALNDEVLVVK